MRLKLKDDLCSWEKLSNAIYICILLQHWQIFSFAYELSLVGSVSNLLCILSICTTRDQMLVYAI